MTDPESLPLEKLLHQISGQWTIFILCVLNKHEMLRFGELRRKVDGISTKVLTERLRKLEAIGILYRNYKPTIPPQVSYKLTERGQELADLLEPLYELAVRWYGNESTML